MHDAVGHQPDIGVGVNGTVIDETECHNPASAIWHGATDIKRWHRLVGGHRRRACDGDNRPVETTLDTLGEIASCAHVSAIHFDDVVCDETATAVGRRRKNGSRMSPAGEKERRLVKDDTVAFGRTRRVAWSAFGHWRCLKQSGRALRLCRLQTARYEDCEH